MNGFLYLSIEKLLINYTMGKINVTIIDATGNKEQEATLPDDASIKRIMEALLPRMKMPVTGPDGEPFHINSIIKPQVNSFRITRHFLKRVLKTEMC